MRGTQRASGNQQRTNDRVATAVGAVVFWPTFLLRDGDNQTTTDPARLEGETDALEQPSTQRSRGIPYQRQPTN